MGILSTSATCLMSKTITVIDASMYEIQIPMTEDELDLAILTRYDHKIVRVDMFLKSFAWLYECARTLSFGVVTPIHVMQRFMSLTEPSGLNDARCRFRIRTPRLQGAQTLWLGLKNNLNSAVRLVSGVNNRRRDGVNERAQSLPTSANKVAIFIISRFINILFSKEAAVGWVHVHCLCRPPVKLQ